MTPSHGDTLDADVLVIGAGAAGLAAARQTAERGLRTLVLEARERTGGRMHSVPAVAGGEAIELGAEYIHGSAPQTRALLAAAGRAAIETGDESWVAGPNGLEPSADFEPADGIITRVRDLAKDESVAAFLERFTGDPTRRDEVRATRAFVEGFDAADPQLASVRGIAAEWRSGVDSSSARPAGGYAPLVAELEAAALAAGASLARSAVVREIAWRAHAVAVTARNATGVERRYTASLAIVTLPIGVLRATGADAPCFEPALPARHRDALARLEMGQAVRIGLAFRTPFWTQIADRRYRDAAFFRTDGKAVSVFWTQWPRASATIVGWAGGPSALRLAALPASERIALARSIFGEMLAAPERTSDEFIGGVSSEWSDDPFARGAYSYVGVGGEDARERLAEPIEQTLFFAGEATALNGEGGTVNGALVSGERAAREACAAFDAALSRR